jgi:hypothetical protein
VIVREILTFGDQLKIDPSMIKDILRFIDHELTDEKIEKKYHACCGRPAGTGSNARTTATATGAMAFQMWLGDFATLGVAALASAPLDTA